MANRDDVKERLQAWHPVPGHKVVVDVSYVIDADGTERDSYACCDNTEDYSEWINSVWMIIPSNARVDSMYIEEKGPDYLCVLNFEATGDGPLEWTSLEGSSATPGELGVITYDRKDHPDATINGGADAEALIENADDVNWELTIHDVAALAMFAACDCRIFGRVTVVKP